MVSVTDLSTSPAILPWGLLPQMVKTVGLTLPFLLVGVSFLGIQSGARGGPAALLGSTLCCPLLPAVPGVLVILCLWSL